MIIFIDGYTTKFNWGRDPFEKCYVPKLLFPPPPLILMFVKERLSL